MISVRIMFFLGILLAQSVPASETQRMEVREPEVKSEAESKNANESGDGHPVNGLYALSGRIGRIEEVGPRSNYDTQNIVVPVYEFAVTLRDIVVEIGEAKYFPERATFAMILSHKERVMGGEFLVLMVRVKDGKYEVEGWDIPDLYACHDRNLMDERYRVISEYRLYTIDDGREADLASNQRRCFQVNRRYTDWRDGMELLEENYERKLEELRAHDAELSKIAE